MIQLASVILKESSAYGGGLEVEVKFDYASTVASAKKHRALAVRALSQVELYARHYTPQVEAMTSALSFTRSYEIEKRRRGQVLSGRLIFFINAENAQQLKKERADLSWPSYLSPICLFSRASAPAIKSESKPSNVIKVNFKTRRVISA